MIRRFAKTITWVLVLGGLGLILWDRGFPKLVAPAIDPAGEAAFDDWVEETPDRRADFSALRQYLQEQGVAGIVPAWQLTRIDGFYARRCELPIFRIPPQAQWANIVPALALVRQHIVPELGPVQVLSSYRTPELNRCAGGASRSNHLDFSALDLATEDRRMGADLYRQLCAIHRDAGSASRMGLGAYFDFAEPNYSGGRFHIDAQGYRSWGRSYSGGSSPCGRFS